MEITGSSNLIERINENAIDYEQSKISEIESREYELYYKQNQKTFQELVKKHGFIPTFVSGTSITEVNSIRQNVLQSYLDATVYSATNFHQLLEQSDVLYQLLVSGSLVESISQNFEIAGSMNASLSSTKIPSYLYDNNFSNSFTVIDIFQQLHLQPVKKFTAKTGTNIGNGEGDGYLQFKWRNIFGGGEKMTLDATKGTNVHSSYFLSLSSPVNPWWLADITAFRHSLKFGGLEIFTKGIRTSVKNIASKKRYWNHEFTFENAWRTTVNRSTQTSDSLMIQCGNDLKQSFTHTVGHDSRDNPVTPSSGYHLKCSNELSLDSYWKSSFEVSKSASWFKNDFITLSASFKSGYIKNFYPYTKVLHCRDKFHSGGPNDVRGFQLMGLGPKDIHDATGGEVLVAYGFSIFSRVPIKKCSSSGFRLHYFINGGRLVNNNSPKFSFIHSIMQEHSLSSGLGLVFKHPAARFELNFTLPITAHTSDSVRKGFQYGLGISFL